MLRFYVPVEYHYDADFGAPWEEYDGHGPVSDWEQRDKNRAIYPLRGSRIYALLRLRGILPHRITWDGWGAPVRSKAKPNEAKAARAAMSDLVSARLVQRRLALGRYCCKAAWR